MKKLIGIIAIVFILCFNGLLFADNGKTIDLSLDEAQKLLEKNNTDMKLIDRKIEIANKQYLDSLVKAENAKGRMHPEESGIVELRKTELLNWKKNQLELNNLKNDRVVRLRSLSSDLQNHYLTALMLKKDLIDIDNEIKNFERKIQESKIKVKAGQMREVDMKSIQAQSFQLSIQRNTVQKQYETTMIAIKKMIGMEIKDTLLLSEVNMNVSTFHDNDIATRIKNASEVQYDILSQMQELDLLKQELKIVEDYSNRKMHEEVESLKNAIFEKELRIEASKYDIEAALWNTYLALKNLEDEIEIEKINTEVAEIRFKAAETSAKSGKISDLQLSNDRLEFEKQKNRLQKKINEYALQTRNYIIQLGE